MSEKAEALREFLKEHASTIIGISTAVVLSTAFIALLIRNARHLDRFMADHNLTEEYHQWLTGE